MIAATSKDRKAMVADGGLREGLFYRINACPIRVSPLRERRDDIPALAFHFLRLFSEEMGKRAPEFSEAVMGVLMNHDWPGNSTHLRARPGHGHTLPRNRLTTPPVSPAR